LPVGKQLGTVNSKRFAGGKENCKLALICLPEGKKINQEKRQHIRHIRKKRERKKAEGQKKPKKSGGKYFTRHD